MRKIPKMKFLKSIILIILFIGCNYTQPKRKTKIITGNPEIKKYVKFLQNQNMPAKNYLLSLFDKYQIVILSERKHYEYTQYDLITDLISDKQFINKVGNIFVEVGNSAEQEKVNELLNSTGLSDQQISQKALNIYRNISFLASWDKTVYYDFLIKLYHINQKLGKTRKIKLFYSDIPFDWNNIKTQDDYNEFTDTLNLRDSIMATQIIKNFESINGQNKKALVILNYRHGFLNIRLKKHGEKENNAGRFLKEKFGDKIASVLINDIYTDKNGKYYPVQNGKWDASFELLNKSNIGFDFNNSPFGDDNFDMYPLENDLTYKDVFTGFVYTSPIDSFIFCKGVSNYVSDNFEKEYIRRIELMGYTPVIKEDTIKRVWKYNEKEWCPNYQEIRNKINKWKRAIMKNTVHSADSINNEGSSNE